MAVDSTVDKWTITGISPATRKAARAAARRENMSLGEWLERVVADAAVARRGRPAPREIPDHRPNRRYF